MHTKHNVPPDTSKGYEQSDLDVSGITKGVIYFFVFAAISGAIGWAFMRLVRPDSVRTPDNLGAKTRVVPAEPNPVLQNDITAKTDIWNLRTRENARLHGQGTDPETGRGYIPIQQAMDMEVRRRGSRGATPSDGLQWGTGVHLGSEHRGVSRPAGPGGQGQNPGGEPREDQPGGVVPIR